MTKKLSQEKIQRVAEDVQDWARRILDPHSSTDFSAGFNEGFHAGVTHLTEMLNLEIRK